MLSLNQDKYYTSIAVASVDILGLNALLEKGDDSDSAMTVLALLRKNSGVKEYQATPSPGDVAGCLYSAEEYFSDSVYFFADPGLEIGKQMDLLAVKCASLMCVGLHISPGFLLRAGIAEGDLRKRIVSTCNGDQEVRIGTAMARAHALEEAQEWIGGATEGGFPGMPKDINRIKYPVPLKSDTKGAGTHEPEAVNWVNGMAMNGYSKADVIDKVKQAVDYIGNRDDKQGDKLARTVEFVEYVFTHPGCLSTQ